MLWPHPNTELKDSASNERADMDAGLRACGPRSILRRLQPVLDTPELPENLGKFRIDSVLGQGGSGVVYGAHMGDRRVALKVLRSDQVPTGRERQRFLDEARNIQRINHPSIVEVIDAGELDDGRPYLAMERLDGQNLGQRLQQGAIPRSHALAIFEQLAAAVGAMHEAGLIHRDLKPENVMLVGDDRAVLLDFGIAKPADAPPSTTTQIGMQRGTPAYMAPERFFGARASLASDVYELGVILYVMLVGGMPWADSLNAKSRLDPIAPSTYDIGLPPALERALMAALSADADERPATVTELAAAIRAVGWGGETVPMRAAGDAEVNPAGRESTEEVRGPSYLARNVLFIAIPLVGVAAAIAITMWATADRGDGESKTEAPPAATTRRAAAMTPAKKRAQVSPAVAAAAGIDAGVAAAPVPAQPADEPRPHEPVAEAPPAKSPPVAEPPVASPQVLSGAAPLPWCRKIAALYCTPEFKATEASMAGALCTSMTKNVATWEGMPQAARDLQDAWCTENHGQLAAAAAARIDFHRRSTRAPATDP